jgi:hypothetical protein
LVQKSTDERSLALRHRQREQERTEEMADHDTGTAYLGSGNSSEVLHHGASLLRKYTECPQRPLQPAHWKCKLSFRLHNISCLTFFGELTGCERRRNIALHSTLSMSKSAPTSATNLTLRSSGCQVFGCLAPDPRRCAVTGSCIPHGLLPLMKDLRCSGGAYMFVAGQLAPILRK